MKKISVSVVLWGVLLWAAACTAGDELNGAAKAPADSTSTLTVFAAASLAEAFTTIGKNFEAANSGVKIIFNFAGSQQLAQQVGQGAPADIFASANKKQMDVAVEAGRVISGTAQIFARNRLVVVIPKDNPAQLASLADLAKPGIKVVFAAKEVPVGQYALDFLDKAAGGELGASYQAAVLQNIVSYEENVRAVLTKVKLGEADAGIVYTSDIGATSEVLQIAIPDPLNALAAYPIAVIADSPHSALAQKLVDYILSPTGQQILEQHGFIRVE